MVLTACSQENALVTDAGQAAPAQSQSRGALGEAGPTAEQKSRPGRDGRTACSSEAVRAYLANTLRDPAPRLGKAFLTNTQERGWWNAEGAGSAREDTSHPDLVENRDPLAFCWFTGNFTVKMPGLDGDVDKQYSHVVLNVPLSGQEGPGVMVADNKAIPAWAPPTS
jgi:hypothetical protein